MENFDKKQILRKFIKKVLLKEFMNGGTGWDSNNDISQFYGSYMGGKKFPYGDTDIPENIKNLDKIKYASDFNNLEYKKFNQFSTNNDSYEFPYDEFKKGIELEKKEQKDEFITDIFSIAEKVIRNIRKDREHYTKLTTYEVDT